MEAPKRSSNILTLLLILFGVTCFLIWNLEVLGKTHFMDFLHPQKLQSLIADHPATAPLIFLLVCALAELATIPNMLIISLGGVIFGKGLGFAYGWIAVLAGCSCSFLISRHLLQRSLQKALFDRYPKLHAIDERLEEDGLLLVTLIRIACPAPHLSWGLGTTRIHFRQYFLASAVGFAPWVGLCTIFAQNIAEAEHLTDLLNRETLGIGIAIITCLLIAAILSHRFLEAIHQKHLQKRAQKKKKKKKKKALQTSSDPDHLANHID